MIKNVHIVLTDKKSTTLFHHHCATPQLNQSTIKKPKRHTYLNQLIVVVVFRRLPVSAIYTNKGVRWQHGQCW